MTYKNLPIRKLSTLLKIHRYFKNGISVFFIFFAAAFFGQVQKLDHRFEILLKNKESLAKKGV